jgi:hypothetical protein
MMTYFKVLFMHLLGGTDGVGREDWLLSQESKLGPPDLPSRRGKDSSAIFGTYRKSLII